MDLVGSATFGKFAVLAVALLMVTSLISPSSTSSLPEVGNDALGVPFTLTRSVSESTVQVWATYFV